MGLFHKVDGTYRKCNLYHNQDGIWNEVKNIYQNINNMWKPVWNYVWATSDWSECSVSCGGGTRTRNVQCLRSDEIIKSDIFCNHLTAKPAVSELCNTNPCGIFRDRFHDCSFCCGNYASCFSSRSYIPYAEIPEVPGIYKLYLDYRVTDARRGGGQGDLAIYDPDTMVRRFITSTDGVNWNSGAIGQHWNTYTKASRVRTVQRFGEYIGEITIAQAGTTQFSYLPWTRRRDHDHVYHIWNLVVHPVYDRPLPE